MILLIDNYDSFTYNLHQYLAELGATVTVARNDEISLDEAEHLAPSHIVLSPGPCTPREAGVSNAVIGRFGPRTPLLGVCLGHQCIGASFGGRVIRAPQPVHGKVARIFHDGQGIFRGLPNPFEATRYHSLIVERETLPDCLEVSAETADGLIMGLRHREYPIEGVQFHPESILTPEGKALLRNFLTSEARLAAHTNSRAIVGVFSADLSPSAPCAGTSVPREHTPTSPANSVSHHARGSVLRMTMFRYAPELLVRFPNLVAGVLLVRELKSGPTPPALAEEYTAEQQKVLARIGETSLSQIPSLAAWRGVFRGFGVDPTQYRSAPEALLRRLTKKGSIPSINALDDLTRMLATYTGGVSVAAVLDTTHPAFNPAGR